MYTMNPGIRAGEGQIHNYNAMYNIPLNILPKQTFVSELEPLISTCSVLVMSRDMTGAQRGEIVVSLSTEAAVVSCKRLTSMMS